MNSIATILRAVALAILVVACQPPDRDYGRDYTPDLPDPITYAEPPPATACACPDLLACGEAPLVHADGCVPVFGSYDAPGVAIETQKGGPLEVYFGPTSQLFMVDDGTPLARFGGRVEARSYRAAPALRVTAAFDITLERGSYLVETAGDMIAARLPPSADVAGFRATVTARGLGNVDLLATQGEKINGAPSLSFAAPQSVTVEATEIDGWFVVARSQL